MKRFGKVIRLKDDQVHEYKRLHDGPGVRDLLSAYNIKNFNIFLHRFPDGDLYEFAYFEYDGNDLKADMARLEAEPRNIEWHRLCDPMQIPLPGDKGWSEMEHIFFNA